MTDYVIIRLMKSNLSSPESLYDIAIVGLLLSVIVIM
jgi:hypothetical protein